MANFQFDFPDDILSDVSGIFDVVAPEMIDEALPIYENAVKTELQPHKDTGDLIKSVRCKKAKKTSTDAYIGYLTAEGAKEDGFRNYQKALAIEYGNSHEPARPFMQSAANSSEKKVLDKLQEVFDRRFK